MSRLMAVAVAAAIFLLFLGSIKVWKPDYFAGPEYSSLPVLDVLGGDFSLPSTLGRDVRMSEFHGKVVLLNFGFSSCPDVCPTVLSRLRKVLLELEGDADKSQAVFVSIDPERDSIEKLTDYLGYFHPAIIGMTGVQERLAQATELYKVYVEKQNMDSSLSYGFLHSDHIFLLDKKGRVRASYATNTPVETISNAVKQLLAES